MATAELAKVDEYTPDKIALIKRTICPDLNNDELSLFIAVCSKTGLDPFARQIYGQKRQGKLVIQTGIDGYRLLAARTDRYAGSDDPVFDDEEHPGKATVTVHKLVGGMRCAFTATARWSEYFPGEKQGFMWNKMPCLMLSKCAEALALRKAFPAELSGLYVKEELDQADDHVEQPRQQADSPRQIAAAEPEPQKPADPVNNPVTAQWRTWLASDPQLTAFNAKVPEAKLIEDDGVYRQVKSMIESHAKACGWFWDKGLKAFTEPPAE